LLFGSRFDFPAFDLRGELYRIVGVDLTDIPGINAVTAHTIISEIGITRRRSLPLPEPAK